MKSLKKSAYLILAILVVSVTACSKDDSPSDDGGGTTGSVGKPGDPHSYHIQFLEGADAGYEVSGKVANDNGLAMYFVDNGENGVLWGMHNDEMNIEGNYKNGPNGHISFPDAPWSMQMYDLNKAYIAKDVSFTVSNEKKEGTSISGFSAFKLTFDGTFYQNINEDDLYRIKGTVIFNLPGN